MANDDESGKGGLDWAVLLGMLATAGIVLSKTLKRGEMTKAQALREMDRADVTTRAGMAKFAEAWKRLDTLQQEERGETIDDATQALQDVQVAALSSEPGSQQFMQAFDRYLSVEQKNIAKMKLDAARQGFQPRPKCPGCGGSGVYICTKCLGKMREELRNYFGQTTWIPCTECGGKGLKTCRVCGGTGAR
jgi:hypothetical protein